MSYQVLAPEAKPCVWMTAGLIRYRLCGRNYDCEGCPLDAAMRGDLGTIPLSRSSLGQPASTTLFPADRSYAKGHLWVQSSLPRGASLWRVGLDAFAAAVLGCVTGARIAAAGTTLHRGDRMCTLDLGMGALELATPTAGRVARGNQLLLSQPQRAVTDPYGDGWLLEIQGLDPGAILGLAPAGRASLAADAALRRFRRALALQLLDEARETRPLSADLRQVLGGSRYLTLLGQFVH